MISNYKLSNEKETLPSEEEVIKHFSYIMSEKVKKDAMDRGKSSGGKMHF